MQRKKHTIAIEIGLHHVIAAIGIKNNIGKPEITYHIEKKISHYSKLDEIAHAFEQMYSDIIEHEYTDIESISFIFEHSLLQSKEITYEYTVSPTSSIQNILNNFTETIEKESIEDSHTLIQYLLKNPTVNNNPATSVYCVRNAKTITADVIVLHVSKNLHTICQNLSSLFACNNTTWYSNAASYQIIDKKDGYFDSSVHCILGYTHSHITIIKNHSVDSILTLDYGLYYWYKMISNQFAITYDIAKEIVCNEINHISEITSKETEIEIRTENQIQTISLYEFHIATELYQKELLELLISIFKNFSSAITFGTLSGIFSDSKSWESFLTYYTSRSVSRVNFSRLMYNTYNDLSSMKYASLFAILSHNSIKLNTSDFITKKRPSFKISCLY